MKTLTLAVYAASALLVAVAVAGACLYNPPPERVYPSWVPAAFLNHATNETIYGDLSNWQVVVSCQFNYTTRAPILSYTENTITTQQFEEMAQRVLHLSKNYLPHTSIGLDGQRLWYIGQTRTDGMVEGDWMLSQVRKLADETVAGLDPYWSLPTDATLRATNMAPSEWSSYIDASGQSVMKTIEYGVRYRWSVASIDLYGCDVGVALSSDYRVNGVFYEEPAVKIVGEQRVRITPDQALLTFTHGRCINGVLDAPVPMIMRLTGGTLTVKDLRLVYYPLKSPDGEVEEILVYRITYTTSCEAQSEIVAYEYAD